MSDPSASGATKVPSAAIWTLPNVISFVRILLIGVFGGFFFAAQDVGAIIVLALAGISDFLDGYLARRWNQVTKLGRLLDPAADRLLTIVVVFGLAVRDIIPWWLVIVLMARDAMVGSALLYGRVRKTPSPHVTFVGKSATFALYVFLPLAYISFDRWDWLHVVAIVGACGAAVLYWVSGVGYVRDIHERASRRNALQQATTPKMDTNDHNSREAS
ncbi:CDP-alcohol phosphatidyltransferase family protein [Demequina sp. B12]|uniref:CDP-alcohol phosphatidyltransferase family protein n=1 Tax=Demequina sp. B12 TaxID=2992757 RepID=UPI00237A89C5|nr:CDP-alcohol phosphatidyltransferase family protein [Demequina sp. B12]MDE0573098.1 CDP-alcohol phosphatidyltransferase family protein [Demequina sp. B12]